ERGTVSDLLIFAEDAERFSQAFAGIGDHREAEVAEIVMILAPGQVYKFTVCRSAEEYRIAIGEVGKILVEFGNFSRAYKGEVFGPPEHNSPFAVDVCIADLRKLFAFLQRYNGC